MLFLPSLLVFQSSDSLNSSRVAVGLPATTYFRAAHHLHIDAVLNLPSFPHILKTPRGQRVSPSHQVPSIRLSGGNVSMCLVSDSPRLLL